MMGNAETALSCCAIATWLPKSINFCGTSVDYAASTLLRYTNEEISFHIEQEQIFTRN
jgi:hypothetical protein